MWFSVLDNNSKLSALLDDTAKRSAPDDNSNTQNTTGRKPTPERTGRKQSSKPKYTQRWETCVNLAKHMWRFYAQHPTATVDTMSRPSYLAWSACNAVYNRLDPSEQAIVRMYFTTPWGEYNDLRAVERYARNNNLTTDYIWSVINKSYRLAAVERGIADANDAAEEQNKPNAAAQKQTGPNIDR